MQNIQEKLLADLSRLGITPQQIKERTTPNPYPIGTKGVWYLAKAGESFISKRLLLDMKDYFEQQEKNEQWQ